MRLVAPFGILESARTGMYQTFSPIEQYVTLADSTY